MFLEKICGEFVGVIEFHGFVPQRQDVIFQRLCDLLADCRNFSRLFSVDPVDAKCHVTVHNKVQPGANVNEIELVNRVNLVVVIKDLDNTTAFAEFSLAMFDVHDQGNVNEATKGSWEVKMIGKFGQKVIFATVVLLPQSLCKSRFWQVRLAATDKVPLDFSAKLHKKENQVGSTFHMVLISKSVTPAASAGHGESNEKNGKVMKKMGKKIKKNGKVKKCR